MLQRSARLSARNSEEGGAADKASARRCSVVAEHPRRTSSNGDVSGLPPDDEFERLDRTELLSRLHSRDEATWISVIDDYEPMLRALGRSYRLAPPDVENAVQRTWLALLTHATDIRNAMCLGAWLASTMRRECLRELPGARSVRHQLVDDWSALEGRCIDGDDAYDAVAGLLDRRQLTTTVWELVDRLPARQRCLLRALYGEDDLSYADVSARTGVPVGSIGPTRQRALRRLRTLLDLSTVAHEWSTLEPAPR
jgi:RNA polymerase sigma factor (sigma-70 family)